MDEQLSLLIELQKLDSEIIAHSNTIKSIPARISSMEKPLKTATAGLQRLKSRYEALDAKRGDKEQSITQNNDRMEKLKERSGEIKDNKSYTAHLNEIEGLEKTTKQFEDELLRMIENADTSSAELKKAEDALKAQEQEASDLKVKLDNDVEVAKQKLSEMKSKRSEYTKPLDPQLFETYMDILTTRSGLAVSRVDSEVCSGCSMNIMPQLFVDIKKNERIIHCPQCRRILFFEAPAMPTEG